MDSEMQELVEDFVKHEIARDEAITGDDGVRHATQCHEAFLQLVKKYGDDGREALSVLFDHGDPRIRLIAAVYLLRYKHEESMSVLQELTKEHGMVALGAEQTMKNWETGNWKVDPEPDAE